MRIGDIVHYCIPKHLSSACAGERRPAIVTGVEDDGRLDLVVFTRPHDNLPVSLRANDILEGDGAPGTWCDPSTPVRKADPVKADDAPAPQPARPTRGRPTRGRAKPGPKQVQMKRRAAPR